MTRPGLRLRAFAARLCDARTMERLIDQAIADLQTEFADAQRQGSRWAARWAMIRGLLSVAKVLVYAVAGEGIRGISDWSGGETVILRRTSVVFVTATILPTMLLTYLQVYRYADENVDLSRLTIYSIPGVLPLSIPLATTFAILCGAAGERLTRRLRLAIIATAIACSMAMVADLAWVVPESNQAFRTIFFDAIAARNGWPVSQPLARGDHEMSMSELRRQMVLRPNETRRLAFTYHQRWSVSMAPLTLAGLALVLLRSVRQRTAAIALAFGLCLGYWFLLQTAQQAVRIGGSVLLAAWSPNIIVALFIIALSWPLRRLSPAP